MSGDDPKKPPPPPPKAPPAEADRHRSMLEEMQRLEEEDLENLQSFYEAEGELLNEEYLESLYEPEGEPPSQYPRACADALRRK